MKLYTNNSTMIRSIEYNARENKLIVEFRKSPTYVYQNVSNVLFLEMIAAESLGKWFHANILKNPEKYPFTRLPTVQED